MTLTQDKYQVNMLEKIKLNCMHVLRRKKFLENDFFMVTLGVGNKLTTRRPLRAPHHFEI